MKLVTYRGPEGSRVGVLSPGGKQILDLKRGVACDLTEKGAPKPEAQADLWVGCTMIDFLNGGEIGMDMARSALDRYGKKADQGTALGPNGEQLSYPLDSVKLMAPVPKPGKIIGIGGNYDGAVKAFGARYEQRKGWPQQPLLFMKAPSAVIGPGDTLILPKISKLVFAEGELCIVMGKRGRYINPKQAYDYVAGYTIGIDGSLHDLFVKDWYFFSGHVKDADPNLNEAPLNLGLAFRGKSMDTLAPLGPWIVTKDEIPDPHVLDMEFKINDDIMQKGKSDMIFKVPDFVKSVSESVTLEPGDVLYSGSLADWRGLKDGDIITGTISKIGTLKIMVKAE